MLLRLVAFVSLQLPLLASRLVVAQLVWGTDFNPSQETLARALAEASSSGAKLFEDSFTELAARPDLPSDCVGSGPRSPMKTAALLWI